MLCGMQRIDKELESALATLEKEKEEALKDLDSQVQHSCLQLFQAVSHGTLGLNGHLGMRVSVTSLTPKLMHMLHDFAQISECPTAVAEAAVVNLSLSCGCTVTCQPRVLTIKHKWASRVWT